MRIFYFYKYSLTDLDNLKLKNYLVCNYYKSKYLT